MSAALRQLPRRSSSGKRTERPRPPRALFPSRYVRPASPACITQVRRRPTDALGGGAQHEQVQRTAGRRHKMAFEADAACGILGETPCPRTRTRGFIASVPLDPNGPAGRRTPPSERGPSHPHGDGPDAPTPYCCCPCDPRCYGVEARIPRETTTRRSRRPEHLCHWQEQRRPTRPERSTYEHHRCDP